MALDIRLLGRPRIVRDGQPVAAPRGRKAWAVLAYVLLAERPVPRARLAELLFADADDALGALRWTLAELRRALGAPAALSGDPVHAGLPDGTRVDVLELEAGNLGARHADGELLEGVTVARADVFEAWLLVARRRIAVLSDAMLRDDALRALATGDPLAAADLVTRLLEREPYDESAHELLVRCLVAAGQPSAALAHARACEAQFLRELGRPADGRVRRAAVKDLDDAVPPTGDRAAAEGQLDAGRAAVDAGATEPGIACLRQAVAEARAVGDPELLSRALATLGSTLVHAPRDRDEEGVTLLHEALALARRCGRNDLAAKASREIGFVDVQAGRAATWGPRLAEATRLSEDDGELASVLAVRGMGLCNRAHYPAAQRLLARSVDLARAVGAPRQVAFSLSVLGRSALLCGRDDEAREALDEALAIVDAEAWVSFLPFPEALRAEVAMRDGDHATADRMLTHAYALGCRVGDPCWEGTAGRARGMLHAAEGDADAALAALGDAAERAGRTANHYVWIRVHCLDALADAQIRVGHPDARGTVDEMGRLAVAGDMRELVVRAALLRGRLGDADGTRTARLLAEAIPNPRLHRELAALA